MDITVISSHVLMTMQMSEYCLVVLCLTLTKMTLKSHHQFNAAFSLTTEATTYSNYIFKIHRSLPLQFLPRSAIQSFKAIFKLLSQYGHQVKGS